MNDNKKIMLLIGECGEQIVKENVKNSIRTSDWYDSEVEALEKVNKNTNNFIIEKHYKKRCWADDDYSDDE